MTTRQPHTPSTPQFAIPEFDDDRPFSLSFTLGDPPFKSDMQNQRNLDDVPEELESSARTIRESSMSSAGPYLNRSAANSTSTFQASSGSTTGTGRAGSDSTAGGGSGRSTPIAAAPPQQQQPAPRPRKTPSIRTMGGRASSDQLNVASPGATASSSNSNARRAPSQGPSSGAAPAGTPSSSSRPPSGSARNLPGAGVGATNLPRYRSVPRLPHDKEIAPAPATGMYWSKAPVWGALPTRILRAHTATLVDSVVWIIGGNDDKDQSRDIYCFDTGAWS